MKRMLLTLCSVLIVTFAQAQEHMIFKDISMDCNLTTFVSKLVAKGYEKVLVKDDAVALTGNFAGKKDCTILVLSSANSHLVWKVSVLFPEHTSWSSLKSEYFLFKESYSKKYGKPESFEYFTDPYEEGDGYELQAVKLEKCIYASYFNTPLGYIVLDIHKDKFVRVTYEDAINAEIRDKEKEQAVSDDI